MEVDAGSLAFPSETVRPTPLSPIERVMLHSSHPASPVSGLEDICNGFSSERKEDHIDYSEPNTAIQSRFKPSIKPPRESMIKRCEWDTQYRKHVN